MEHVTVSQAGRVLSAQSGTECVCVLSVYFGINVFWIVLCKVTRTFVNVIDLFDRLYH